MILSEKIVYLRKKKGWSQEQLANKLEVSRQAVYKWEANISLPEIDKLKKMAKIFSVSFNELLDDEVDINNSEGEALEESKEEQISSELNNGEEKPAELPAEAENSLAEAVENEKISAPVCENKIETTNKGKDKKALMAFIVCLSVTAIIVGVLSFFFVRYLLSNDKDKNKDAESSTTSSSLVQDSKKSDSNSVKDTTPSQTTDSTKDSTSGDLEKPDNSKYYTVTFETDGGTPVSSIKVKENSLITEEIFTEKNGYILFCWVDDINYEEWDFDSCRVTQDMTLYAFWMPDSYITVTFDRNDGSGETVEMIGDPTEPLILENMFPDSEYQLLGWICGTSSGVREYSVNDEVYITEPCTFYAKWGGLIVEDFEFELNFFDTYTLKGYHGTNPHVVIPSYYNGIEVTHMASDVFYGCETLESIVLPEIISEIGEELFYGCTNLRTLYIPSSVGNIHVKAFITCESLENIFVDVYNTEYSDIDGVLYNYAGTRLTKYPCGREDEIYEIPDGTHYIEDYAFYGCGLSEVIFPDGVGGIGVSAFENSYYLGYADLGNRIDYVGACAFKNCMSLQEICFEYEKIWSLGNYAFLGCESLVKAEFWGDVDVIGFEAFGGCIMLESVIVKGELGEVDKNAFEGCNRFTGITQN